MVYALGPQKRYQAKRCEKRKRIFCNLGKQKYQLKY